MPETKRPLKVFLCHSSQDKPAVRELFGLLRTEGWIDPWLDKAKILPGQDWRIVIEKAVEDSDVVIVCLSTHSVSKEGFVQREIKYAYDVALEKPEETIFLIPLRLDDCIVPRGLRSFHWVNYFDAEKNDAYLDLLGSLKLRYEQILRNEEEDHTCQEKKRLEPEAADHATQEKAERESTERRIAQVAALQETFSRSVNSFRLAIPKAMPFLRIGAIIGIIFILFWLGSWAKSQFLSLIPTANPSETPHPTNTFPFPSSTADFTKTAEPSTTPTSEPAGPQTMTATILPDDLGAIVVEVNRLEGINCRRDPIIDSAIVRTISASEKVNALSRDKKGEWLFISLDNVLCWANSAGFRSSGDIQELPVSEITDAKGVPMVLVPAGNFTMGSENGESDERPIHTVDLDSYYIDKYEVTNRLYKACVDAGMCQAPKNRTSLSFYDFYGKSEYDNYPVMFIGWNMAKTYCEWRGAKLPTEARWEKAARGTDGRSYPWGDQIDQTFALYGQSGGIPSAVGSYESGKSPYRVYDMAGNLSEWVEDWYSQNFYANSPISNPSGPGTGQYRVHRGGTWYDDKDKVRAANRNFYKPDEILESIGFRCAKSP